MKTVLVALLGIFLAGQANAADYYLLSIKAEKTADKVARLGIRTDDKNQITHILYLANNETTPDEYSVDKATKSPVVMVRKFFFDIVKFRITQASPSALTVTFQYVFTHSGFNMTYHKRQISIAYNEKADRYEAYDPNAKRFISTAYATNHMEDGELKGIDEIKTW